MDNLAICRSSSSDGYASSTSLTVMPSQEAHLSRHAVCGLHNGVYMCLFITRSACLALASNKHMYTNQLYLVREKAPPVKVHLGIAPQALETVLST
jgi:hypothetical protein